MVADPAKHSTLPDGARVLVVRLSSLGDVLFALETVASLKAERPDVQIDFLVEDRFAAILDEHPDLAAVRIVPRRGPFAKLAALRALRRVRYDVLLDLHGLAKSAVAVAGCRAAVKLGFAPPGAREGAHIAYHRAIELPAPLPHRADRGLHLLRALGLRGEPTPARLGLPAGVGEFWRSGTTPRIVLHPGTSAFASFKRWPVERFAALAAHLAERGARLAVSFGPGEAALAAMIRARAPSAQPIDGAAVGLRGLAAIYRDAELVVAADTGPLHIAAAVGTRVLALFGPKDARLYGPRGPRAHVVLSHDVPCRPCRRRACATPQCVLGIDTARVVRAVDELLAGIGA